MTIEEYKKKFIELFKQLEDEHGPTRGVEIWKEEIAPNLRWAKLKLHFDMSEQVNHPHYYQKNGRECIDVMIEKFGTEAVINFCECNEFKYLWRAGLKEGNSAETDRAKGAWYRRKAEELRNANH